MLPLMKCRTNRPPQQPMPVICQDITIRVTPSRVMEVATGLFSLFWQPQRPPMATKGERGDVPAPWGAWLAFGVAMVCSGGLPAVVWAGCCCCGEGRPSPLWGRCGPLGVTHGPCNGHPTRRGPGKGRLWVGGGMGPCVGHVNAAMPTRSGPPRPFVLFLFLAAPGKQEPPRNGIKNRSLLCFEVPVASGRRVPRRQAPQRRAENDF